MSNTISQSTHNNSLTCTGVDLYSNISSDDTIIYFKPTGSNNTLRYNSVVYRKDRIWQKEKQHHYGFPSVVEDLTVGKVKINLYTDIN